MINSTGEKSWVRGVITNWGGGGGAHIALLPVTSKIISINIHVHYISLMTVIFQLLSICQNRLDPSWSLFSKIIIYNSVERIVFHKYLIIITEYKPKRKYYVVIHVKLSYSKSTCAPFGKFSSTVNSSVGRGGGMRATSYRQNWSFTGLFCYFAQSILLESVKWELILTQNMSFCVVKLFGFFFTCIHVQNCIANRIFLAGKWHRLLAATSLSSGHSMKITR